MSNRAVWITGVGTTNPLGNDYNTTAVNLLNGTCGITKADDLNLPAHLSRIAARLPEIAAPDGWTAGEFARRARTEQLLIHGTQQALDSAGLWDRRTEIPIGFTLGLGGEWLFYWEADRRAGGNRVGEPEQDQVSTLERVQKDLDLRGPTATVGAACASGNYALATARQWIRRGWIDVCLAAAGEVFVTAMSMACFGNLRALSRRNDAPNLSSRPFDIERDGFVMGEGGVVFVLESAYHGRQRGAQPLAEIAGFGASSDAHHMVIPSPEPAPAVAAMRAALADARINPQDVDYVNAHATSTPMGDIAEARVLQTVFGQHTDNVPVSSTKSMTGHLLSGAAAMNALACIVALNEQALPPTINLDHPDPECSLRHVAHQAQPQNVHTVVSNSLGFGGSNTSIVLCRAGWRLDSRHDK